MSFSIRLTTDERNLVESYAKIHGISLSDAFRNALFEKIEDEFDLKIAEEAIQEYEASGRESRPISELWKELEL